MSREAKRLLCGQPAATIRSIRQQSPEHAGTRRKSVDIPKPHCISCDKSLDHLAVSSRVKLRLENAERDSRRFVLKVGASNAPFLASPTVSIRKWRGVMPSQRLRLSAILARVWRLECYSPGVTGGESPQ